MTQLPNLQRSSIKIKQQGSKPAMKKSAVNFVAASNLPNNNGSQKADEIAKSLGDSNKFNSPKFVGRKGQLIEAQQAYLSPQISKNQHQFQLDRDKNQPWQSYDNRPLKPVKQQSAGFDPSQPKSQSNVSTPVPKKGKAEDLIDMSNQAGAKQAGSPTIFYQKGPDQSPIRESGKMASPQSQHDPASQVNSLQSASHDNFSPVQSSKRNKLISTPVPKKSKYQQDPVQQSAAPQGYSQSQSKPWDSTASRSGGNRFSSDVKNNKNSHPASSPAFENAIASSNLNSEMRQNGVSQFLYQVPGQQTTNFVQGAQSNMEGLAGNVQAIQSLAIQNNNNPNNNLVQSNNSQEQQQQVGEAPRELEKYTLVLDMDETLLHFNHIKRFYRPRPHVHEFLREMSQYFHLIVFTAGMKDYADWLLNDLDKQRLIKRRLYRGSCSFRRGVYMKDLKKIKSDLRKTIIIDNMPENFNLQPDNGIPIRSWFNDNPNDTELVRIGAALKEMAINQVPDVRQSLREFLRKPMRMDAMMPMSVSQVPGLIGQSPMRFANNAKRNQSVVAQQSGKNNNKIGAAGGLGVPAGMLATGGQNGAYQRYLASPNRQQQPRLLSSSPGYGAY